MIRVIVELVPYGNEDQKMVIGSLVLANTMNLGLGLCQYHAVYELKDVDDSFIMVSKVKHMRQDGVWELLRKILNKKPTSKTNMVFNILKGRL